MIRKELTPVNVRKDLIHCGRFAIDRHYGLTESESETACDDVNMISLAKINYSGVYIGEVFIPDDPEIESFDEPSLFLMKMKHSNWYLTGNDECPVGIDNSVYDKVWIVTDKL